MSGRAVRQQDRARACWHGGDSPREASRDAAVRDLITTQRREEMRRMALGEPDKLVRCLRLARVVSLRQLPWWPEFRQSYPWEAAELVLLAQEAGVSDR